MNTLRIGSQFSGYGGLDLAVASALGGDVVWHTENDPAASKVLAHHWPHVPNHGDVTTVDWARVEPVEVLCGGFPCTDVSSAGKRAGLRPDTRSGLWSHMAYAIFVLRPGIVVIENVRGILSADAECDLELCPWCLGDDEGRPLRALGSVLGDLADLGYDARWCGLRAADVGAPHGRYRIFITARNGDDGQPSAAHRVGPSRRGSPRLRWSGSPDHRQSPAHADSQGPQGCGLPVPGGTSAVGDGSSPDADTPRDGRGEGWSEPAGQLGGSDAAHPGGRRCRRGQERHGSPREPGQYSPPGHDAVGRVLEWGDYTPAIRRWELILGRPAPAPTQTGKRGGQQLSSRFVEWMMGLPAGWVTGVPGLSRNDQLKLLGRGVVPQQCAAALSWLRTSMSERAA